MVGNGRLYLMARFVRVMAHCLVYLASLYRMGKSYDEITRHIPRGGQGYSNQSSKLVNEFLDKH